MERSVYQGGQFSLNFAAISFLSQNIDPGLQIVVLFALIPLNQTLLGSSAGVPGRMRVYFPRFLPCMNKCSQIQSLQLFHGST